MCDPRLHESAVARLRGALQVRREERRRFGVSAIACGVFAVLALACAAPLDARPRPPLEELVEGRLLIDASPLPPAGPGAGTPIRLPDPWSVHRPDAKGYAWYLFDWTLAEPPDGIYAIYLPGINTQAQLFVNDTLAGATGDLAGRLPQSWERAQAFALPFALPRQGVNRVAIRVNVPAAWAGGLEPIVVGPAADVRRLAFADLVVTVIGPALVSVTIIVLGLFILGLWLRRRDATYALFGGSAILWGVHTLLSALPTSPLPPPHWAIWWHGMYLAFACMLCLFCRKRFRDGMLMFPVTVFRESRRRDDGLGDEIAGYIHLAHIEAAA